MANLGWGLQITVLGMGLVLGLLALLWGLLVLVLRFDRPAAAVAGQPRAAEGPDEWADGEGGAGLGATPRAAVVSTGGPRGATAGAGGSIRSAGSSPEPAVLAAIGLAIALHRAQARADGAPSVRAHWPGSLLHASRWVATGRARQHRSWRKGG